MNNLGSNINWVNMEEMEALSTAVPKKDNMVTNVPSLLVKE